MDTVVTEAAEREESEMSDYDTRGLPSAAARPRRCVTRRRVSAEEYPRDRSPDIPNRKPDIRDRSRRTLIDRRRYEHPLVDPQLPHT